MVVLTLKVQLILLPLAALVQLKLYYPQTLTFGNKTPFQLQLMQMVGITTTAMVTEQTQMQHLQHLKLVNSLDSHQVLISLLQQQPPQL